MKKRIINLRLKANLAHILLIGCTTVGPAAFAWRPPPPPNGPGMALNLLPTQAGPAYLDVDDNVWFAGDFTIEAWVFPRSYNYWSRLLDFGNGAGLDNVVVALTSATTGKPHFQVVAGTQFGTGITAPNPLPLNQWSHLACVLSGSTGTIYINGVAVTNGLVNRPLNTLRTNCFIGRSNFSADDSANAMFDEMRIWNVARDASQIQQAMRRQLYGDEWGLVAYWRFDETDTPNAYDATRNRHDAMGYWTTKVNSTIFPFAPTIEGHLDTVLSATSVRLLASARANNGAAKVYFEYGLTNYTSVGPPYDLGSGTDPMLTVTVLTGLMPGTTYRARAVATNEHGPSYGANFSFTMPMRTNVVLNTFDSGFGSLRDVIRDLSPGDSIRFAPGLSGEIGLTSGALVIDKDMTILGPAANQLSLLITGRLDRVLNVSSGRVLISGLTFRGGYVQGAAGANATSLSEDGGNAPETFGGGGILNYGDLTLVNCTVADCTAVGGKGGTGGDNFGILSPGRGGHGGGAQGGGIFNSNRLTLIGCAFYNNLAQGGFGGTGGNDGNINPANSGGLGGAGGWAWGGAIESLGTFLATNCTFFTNLSSGGNGGRGGDGVPNGGAGGQGGGATTGAIDAIGISALVNCTVFGNAAMGAPGGQGGSNGGRNGGPGRGSIGGFVHAGGSPAPAYVRNTIMAGNRADDPEDIAGFVISGGFNLIGITNASWQYSSFTNTTDQAGQSSAPIDPKLGAFGYYGGPTKVLSPLPNSPARDRGHSSGATTDQRGFPRPFDDSAIPNVATGDGSDIGAFEAQSGSILLVTTTVDTGPGSLHQAILDANARPGPDSIFFEIPGSGVRTLDLSLALPTITDPVTIDGFTQPGASRGTPPLFNDPLLLVELDCTDISGGECCAPGLEIQASNCVVRGLVINRAPGPGIQLDGANNNLIEANFIGTDPTGTIAQGNGTDGILIQNSANNLIGGTNDWSQRNVISGNSNGVTIVGAPSMNNVLNGNCIGTDLTGGVAVSNRFDGVVIERASSNHVGIPYAAIFNTISGNGRNGVRVSGTAGNFIQANLIGPDRLTQSRALTNYGDGILLDNSRYNLVGGRALADINVISGNRSNGVHLTHSTKNVVGSNFIGVNGTGTSVLANGRDGVSLEDSATNSIGYVTGVSDGTLIGGNAFDGIYVSNSPGVVIRGSAIGTDFSGKLNLGNGSSGVVLQSSDGAQIGTAPGYFYGNLIGNNEGYGLHILSHGCLVLGNYIGSDRTGTRNLGNGGGVHVYGSYNIIGGTQPGSQNLVAFNAGVGVFMGYCSNCSSNNIIRGNSIYANGFIGIGLGYMTPSTNDPGDADDGPNHRQNYPVLTRTTNIGAGLTIEGTLNSHANTTYLVDFYANPQCDSFGHGEGQWYLGATTLTTDAAGNAAFSVQFPPPQPGTHFITATATDPDGNTSEFSACAVIAGGAPSVTIANTNDSGPGSLRDALAGVADGGTISFTAGVTNTITLTSGELAINKSVAIEGPGADVLAVSGRLKVLSGTVSINGLTIRDGQACATTPGADGMGGGVFNAATLTLSDCAIIGNVACGANGTNGTTSTYLRNGGAGGNGWGGGIYNTGQLAMIRCTVANNESRGGTGGNAGAGGSGPLAGRGGAGGSGFGGAIYNLGTLSLLDCTFAENQSWGAAGGVGGTGSTAAGAGGLGGQGLGGGIMNDGTLSLFNCTLATNRTVGGTGGAGGLGADYDGPGGAGGNADGGNMLNRGTQYLVNVTVAGGATTGGLGGSGFSNGALGLSRGGGVFASTNSTFFINTLVGDNRAVSSGPDVFGAVTSFGHNLISITNGSSGWTNTDLLGSAATPRAPLLQPLASYGGPTLTLLPMPGSPAFDAGDDLVLAAPYLVGEDQRGGLRRVGAHVDIGAVEVGAFLRITDIRDRGSQFDLSVTSERGWMHFLESSDALDAGAHWALVPNSTVLGNGAVKNVSDTRLRSLTKRFYRAVLAQ